MIPRRLGQCLILLCWLIVVSGVARAQPVPVTVERHGEGWRLSRGGEPYPIRGAGGDASKAMLAAAGANSFRTWGIDDQTADRLDEAHRLGLTVTLGIWLGHPRHGFDYADPAQVRAQYDAAKAAVLAHRDHPALLLWAVGNEMEAPGPATDPMIWQAVNDIASMIHELDPHHPTLTVIAEIGGDRLASIQRDCPAIDIVGINSYGGVTTLPERYARADLDRPYIVTEYGPPGSWEITRNVWGVPEELSSTAKAAVYREAQMILADDPACLGSYAFLWGAKQEATATWFGMFLADGSRLGAVDVLTQAWSDKPPANLSPRIISLSLDGPAAVGPGTEVHARLQADDPEGDPLTVEWVLHREMQEFESGGDHRAAPPIFPDAINISDTTGVQVRLPEQPGNYRLFVFVRDGQGNAATANLPLRVEADEPSAEAATPEPAGGLP